jgi:hypothetical protein
MGGFCNREKSPEKLYYHILRRISWSLFLKKHPYPCKNEKTSEDDNNPMETVNKGNAGKNKSRSHYQSSKNAPEQYLMLVPVIYPEIRKNENEYKNIVNTQGIFNYISCKEFKSFGPSCIRLGINKQMNADTENYCERYPYHAPYNSLFDRHFMDFFMKNTQIKSQHQEYENVESDPEVNAYSHVRCIRMQTYKKSPYPQELQSQAK